MRATPGMGHFQSPQLYARAAGVLYLIEIALAFTVNPVWSHFVGSSATPGQLAAPLSPWRMAFAGEIATYVCYAVIAVMFYALFRPVNQILALLSTLLMLTHAAIGAVSALGRLGAVLLIVSQQSHTMATIALSLHNYGHEVGLVFFAGHCMVLAYLIYRSGYLPKAFGAFFLLGAFCLLTDIATDWLAPAINAAISPAILLPFFLAQLSFALWLTIVGIDVRNWPTA